MAILVTGGAGYISTCFADANYSAKALNWSAKENITAMIKDHWNWQYKNPKGYINAN